MKTNRIVVLLALMCAFTTLFGQNPIVQTCYTADPAPMVDGDRLYVYIDRDEGPDWYVMNEWRVYSTADMVNWTDHGACLPLTTFTWAKAGTAWASQCIKSPKTGKYYWYVCCEQTSGGMAIGVAVGDTPVGPFSDPLKRPLINGGWGYIDPSPFIDTDGNAYLVFGNPGCFIAKLNSDMISYDKNWTVYGSHVRKEQNGIWEFYQDENSFGGPKDIPDGKNNSDYKDLYEEGPWLTKRGNLYYLMYAAGGVPEHISYSTSSSPTGPWTYRGQIMRQQSTNSFTNHAGLCTFKGHDYFFYHTGWLPGGNGFKRAMAVEEFKYNADGTIPSITATRTGVNPIGTLNPYERQEAETMATSSGVKSAQSGSIIYINDLQNGDFTKLRNVDFGAGATSLTVSLSSTMSGGKIVVSSAQSGGTVYATIQIPNTGGGWQEVSADLSSALSGVKDIYFRFEGASSGNICNFDWWKFNNSNISSVPTRPFKNVWTADNGDGTFTNPIINADAPDIDIIRVGDTYYMVTTTMYIFPGATIFKSKDLVNWEYCCNPLKYIDNNDAYNLQNGKHHYSQGQWASSLKYHNGKFYLYFIAYGRQGVDSGRNVLLTATDPEGEWTMTYMNDHYYDSGWMFDDGPNGDGNLYVACGIGTITVNKLNPNTLAKISSKEVITNKDGYEGAHMYHIGNYYYLYLTTGGYWRGQTIYRSTNPMGPYTECPNGNVQAGSVFSGQGIHQGGLVQTQTGEWWTIMFKDAGAIGRVPYLEPVRWVDGWPIIGDNGTDVSKNSRRWTKPNVGATHPITHLPTNDPFVDATLGMQWGWNHNPDNRAWSLTERKGWLRLKSCSVTNTVIQARNTLMQRIMGYDPEGTPNYAMKDSYGTAKFDVSGMKDGDVCGLVVFQDNHGYIGVKSTNGKKYFVQYLNNFNGTNTKEVQGPEVTGNTVYLRAVCNFGSSKAKFYYSTDNKTFTQLGNTLDMNYTLTVFTGNRFGLFNYSTKSTGGYVDVDWFTTESGTFNESDYYSSSTTVSGTSVGNSMYDSSTGRYYFYTPTYSSFIFSQYAGTKLEDCIELSIDLGNHTVGYRLDVQLKDASGNIIKDGTNDYILGTEAAGTRITDIGTASSQVFDLQEIYASYLEKYPNCTIGEIRINTVVAEEDVNREGKYYITINKMDLTKGRVTARSAALVSLTDIPMVGIQKDYAFNFSDEDGKNFIGWGDNVAFTFEDRAGTNNSKGYKIVNNTKKNSWEAQFNIQKDNFYFTEGKEYSLRLDIKGSTSGRIGAGFQKSDGWEGRGSFPDINVTTDWNTVEVSAIVTGAAADRLLLNVGEYTGTLYIDNIQVYSVDGSKTTEIVGTHTDFKKELNSGEVAFGSNLTNSVPYTDYADLSSYKKLVVKGSGGEVRLLFNRQKDESFVEKTGSLQGGSFTIDLTSIDSREYVRLNAIKAQWGNTINISDVLLTGDNGIDEFADYYISGAGKHDAKAKAALNDVKATVIDVTGYSGKTVDVFTSANPNCLLIFSPQTETLIGGAFDLRNTVKKDNDYSVYRLGLYSDYNFRSPIEINCFAGADITFASDVEWSTAVAPFDLNVSNCGADVYALKSLNGKIAVLEPVTKGSIAANTPFIYRNKAGNDIKIESDGGVHSMPTPSGFNVSPLSNLKGWYTAMTYTEQTIDVTANADLKNYDVYVVENGNLNLVEGKLTTKPFSALFLKDKTITTVANTVQLTVEGEANAISDTPSDATATKDVYSVQGYKILSNATLSDIQSLPRGLYIINGKVYRK